MAEYGIVVGIKDIKGNCQLEGYKDQILAEAVEFGSGASRVGTGFGAKDSVSVTQSSVNIVMNVSTPDVQGFQRSQGQIAAQVSRALSRGQRNK